MARSWTTGEVEELRRMSRDGLPLREIAARLERTLKAVGIQAVRMGIRSPRQSNWSTAELRRARMLYDTGFSPTEIGKEIGRSVRSVSAQLSRHGGRDVRRKRESKLRSHVTEYALWSQGLTCREILIVLGRPDGPSQRRGLAMILSRYIARTGLPRPPDHRRRFVSWPRVEEARRQLYGQAVAPLDRERAAS